MGIRVPMYKYENRVLTVSETKPLLKHKGLIVWLTDAIVVPGREPDVVGPFVLRSTDEWDWPFTALDRWSRLYLADRVAAALGLRYRVSSLLTVGAQEPYIVFES